MNESTLFGDLAWRADERCGSRSWPRHKRPPRRRRRLANVAQRDPMGVLNLTNLLPEVLPHTQDTLIHDTGTLDADRESLPGYQNRR